MHSTCLVHSRASPKRPMPPPHSDCWPWWRAKTSSKEKDGTWKIARKQPLTG